MHLKHLAQGLPDPWSEEAWWIGAWLDTGTALYVSTSGVRKNGLYQAKAGIYFWGTPEIQLGTVKSGNFVIGG